MSCSHYAESSGAGRARSRVQGSRSSHIPSACVDPVGELSGFPLVMCPDCGLARVVEGRTKKEGDNHGHLFFKWRNGYPKLCGFYRFEKQYFEHPKSKGVILVRPSNWTDLVDDENASVDSPDRPVKKGKDLEQKMESLIFKMNMFIVVVVSVIVGAVLVYVLMK